MLAPQELTHAELITIVETIRVVLYAQRDETGAHFWNPDKEWCSADTLEAIAQVFARHDLVPLETGPLEPGSLESG